MWAHTSKLTTAASSNKGEGYFIKAYTYTRTYTRHIEQVYII